MKHKPLLLELLNQPTAPFREGHVQSVIVRALSSAQVPHFFDPFQNLVIGVAHSKEYLKQISKKTQEPLRLFIAHMDHPGFHGLKLKSETELEFEWHGGSPTAHLQGARVWLGDQSGYVGAGRISEFTLTASGRGIQRGVIRTERKITQTPKELYGGFGFRAPVWEEEGCYFTKAADDLVGAFAITSMALDFFARKHRKGQDLPFLGLLTRAEEVGFIGTLAHLELGWIQKRKRTMIAVSLETSKTLPQAEIGKGPVVRLGDRFTVFDPGATRVLADLAQKVLPDEHQKRIMDGGSCEASAATVYGLPAIGISVPLGNYHNQSFEGGPDAAPPNGPAPEFVHVEDVRRLLILCNALLTPKLAWDKPWEKTRKSFRQSLKKYKRLLRLSVS